MRWVVNCHRDHAARYVRVLSVTQGRKYRAGPPAGYVLEDVMTLQSLGIVGIYATRTLA
jgi:hypothetical protein